MMTAEPQRGARGFCRIGSSGSVTVLVLVGVGGGVTVRVIDSEREPDDDLLYVTVDDPLDESDDDKASVGVTSSLTVVDNKRECDGVGGGVMVEVIEGNDNESDIVTVKNLRDGVGDAEADTDAVEVKLLEIEQDVLLDDDGVFVLIVFVCVFVVVCVFVFVCVFVDDIVRVLDRVASNDRVGDPESREGLTRNDFVAEIFDDAV
jgi:hypothetical protein